MFYYKKDLSRLVRLHPKYIQGNPIAMVRKLALQGITNSFTKDHGYFIMVVRIKEVGEGLCLPQLGMIEYPVHFDAIVLFPVVGEVVDAEVVEITNSAIIFRYICMFGIVRSYSLGSDNFFKYHEQEVVVVEKGEFPATIKEAFYRSKLDNGKIIGKGTIIRLRIIDRTIGGNGFFLIGTMEHESLGPLSLPPAALPLAVSSKEKIGMTSKEKIEMSSKTTNGTTEVDPSILSALEALALQ